MSYIFEQGRNYHSCTTASTIATSIVHAKLDYCSSLFLNIDLIQINRLQAIQNALACALTKTPKHHHITSVLRTLHWLKIPERLENKVMSCTYITHFNPSSPPTSVSCSRSNHFVQPVALPPSERSGEELDGVEDADYDSR